MGVEGQILAQYKEALLTASTGTGRGCLGDEELSITGGMQAEIGDCLEMLGGGG